jgi:hydrogenase maturation protein HypF
MTFEGQAAMWLEYLARGAVHATGVFPLTFDGREIDWRPMLAALVDARVRGTPVDTIARVFHRSVGRMIASVARRIADDAGLATVVLSGGVMQNDLLLADVRDALAGTRLELWTNRAVPPNDGGISLGQAAFAACSIGV